MMMEKDKSSAISLKRLQTLTDVFFALCLILMIIFIEKPSEDMPPTEEAIRKYLFGQSDVIVAYLVTFINISFYWFFSHNESRYMRRSDGVHVWLTILTLMFVGLLPFSNSLTVAFPSSLTVQVFYSLTVFLVGVLFLADWLYAIVKDRLVDRSLNEDVVDRLIVESLVQPVAALVSLGGSFFGYFWWQVPYLIVPLAEIAVNRAWAMNRIRRKAASGGPREGIDSPDK